MLTQEKVKKLFEYREDGLLIWKIRLSNRGLVGAVAGVIGVHGYRIVGVENNHYRNNRLVWLWHNGYLPEQDVDHIDKVRDNDRIENLRECSRVCNLRNSTQRSDNTSGIKGVYWSKAAGKWMASIRSHGKQIHLGLSSDFDEAVRLRLAGEQALNWGSCDYLSPADKYLKSL